MKPTQFYDRQKRTPVTPEDQAEDWWCPALRRAIHDRDTLVHYNSRLREYCLILIITAGAMVNVRNGKVFGAGEPGRQYQNRHWYNPQYELIHFCPYCGSELPFSPWAAFDERSPKIDMDGDLDPPLAEEMQSNAWWKTGDLEELEREFREAYRRAIGQYALPDPRPRCVPEDCGIKGWLPYEHCLTIRDRHHDFWTPLTYIARWREYGVRMIDWRRRSYNQPLRYDPIFYSPWCGRRYPSSLKSEWLE